MTAATSITLNDKQREFHLKEYETVRAEVTTLLARIENLFKYSFVASATVFAWLITNTIGTQGASGTPPGVDLCLRAPHTMVALAWGIPAAFTYAALALAFINNLRVQQLGAYLRRLEVALGHTGLGWEGTHTQKFPMLTLGTGLVWVALLIASTAAAKYGLEAASAKESTGRSVASVQQVPLCPPAR